MKSKSKVGKRSTSKENIQIDGKALRGHLPLKVSTLDQKPKSLQTKDSIPIKPEYLVEK